MRNLRSRYQVRCNACRCFVTCCLGCKAIPAFCKKATGMNPSSKLYSQVQYFSETKENATMSSQFQLTTANALCLREIQSLVFKTSLAVSFRSWSTCYVQLRTVDLQKFTWKSASRRYFTICGQAKMCMSGTAFTEPTNTQPAHHLSFICSHEF